MIKLVGLLGDMHWRDPRSGCCPSSQVDLFVACEHSNPRDESNKCSYRCQERGLDLRLNSKVLNLPEVLMGVRSLDVANVLG